VECLTADVPRVGQSLGPESSAARVRPLREQFFVGRRCRLTEQKLSYPSSRFIGEHRGVRETPWGAQEPLTAGATMGPAVAPGPSSPRRGVALLLAREELLDVLAAELGTFDDRMTDAREHLLEPGAELTLADLLGAPLDPLGRLVHLGLVGGGSRSARKSQGRQESGKD